MNQSDVTAPVKSTARTVPFGIFIGGGIASLMLPILLPMICNAALPPVDAERAKTFYLDNFSLALAIVTTGGGLGAVGGSLAGRIGKILAQLAPGMATDATPNGEGIALASEAITGDKDALKNAAIGLPTDQLQHASGVDLSGALNYVDVTAPGVPMESE